MKKPLILIMVMVMTGLVLSAARAQVNVRGDWTFTMTTPRGDRTSDLTFDQSGERLTVSMKGDFGEGYGEGTLKGQDIEWTITRQTQRGAFAVTYKGKVADGNTMSGEVQMGDMDAGQWQATRKPK
jgi:hypothetical protein